MNFKKLAIYTLALGLLGATVGSCENPLKDFDLQINTNVFQHTATVEVLNNVGAPVSNVTLRLAGGDTQHVYNLQGTKTFALATDGNIVTFGVDPARPVHPTNPVAFKLEVAAPGYVTQTVDVVISSGNNGIKAVRLMPIQNPPLPEGAVSETVVVEIGANGTTVSPVAIAVGDPTDDVQVAINIPAGISFLGANGQPITAGGALTVEVVGFDPTDIAVVQELFPGGSLQASGIVLEDGSIVAGTFNPAGTTTIDMTVGGVPVRQFSEPIEIGMSISPDFTLSSGAPISAGDILSVFSFSDYDPTWRHQADVAVTSNGNGGMNLSFSTDHLTTFVATEFLQSCAQTVSVINVTADWIPQAFTYPVIVEAVVSGSVLASREYSVNSTSATLNFEYLPATGAEIVIRSASSPETILGRAPLADCGSETTVAVSDPRITDAVTLQLYVRCPGQEQIVTLLPTFFMEYRVAGTNEWQFLGQVNNGYLRTGLLQTNGTVYDFRATWGNTVKIVRGHQVQADNMATVGDNPSLGEILGSQARVMNLRMLEEACNEL